jgi:NADH dehydrogenase
VLRESNRRLPLLPVGPRVVVAGAGFAGLAAVRALRGSGAQVTLVDRNVYATFQPLLYQVATGGLNPGDVAYPVRGFAAHHETRFRRGTVVALENGAVRLDDGERLPYDYLVLATGVTTKHFGTSGAAEHSFALYTRSEAIVLRDALMGRLEHLAENPDGQLSLVVVGGGPTGVEAAGALAELCGAGIRAGFPEVDPAHVQVVLVERGDELLTAFHPKLRTYALAQLRRRGIDVRLETAVREVGVRTITLEDGTVLPADLTVWAAGIGAPPQVADWGLKQGPGGRLLVGPDLRVPGSDRIFIAGDVALDADDPIPQLAAPAIQMGAHVAEQILRLEDGQATTPFHYRYKGDAATIGRNAAVIQLPHRILLTGPIAWLGWLGLHIVMLLGLRNRISTLLNLGWRYLVWPRGGSLIVGDSPSPRKDP